jgi:hypothetical protein
LALLDCADLFLERRINRLVRVSSWTTSRGGILQPQSPLAVDRYLQDRQASLGGAHVGAGLFGGQGRRREPGHRERLTRLTVTTVRFEAPPGQTLLTFIDAGFPTGEDLGMFETGTVAVLDAFKRVAETPAV